MAKLFTYKKDLKGKMYKIIKEKKFDMQKIEIKEISSCERRRTLRLILLQPFTCYKLKSTKRLASSQLVKVMILLVECLVILHVYWLLFFLIHDHAEICLQRKIREKYFGCREN